MATVEKKTVWNQRLVNIGCGRNFHPAWENLDLEPADSSVIAHDVVKGLPFSDSNVDAVYHSHILEHLRPGQGEMLIEECFRVLRPGGILRIVVPDLERIVELYLESHQQAWNGEESAELNYNWMKLELLDQLVRERSGGRMGQYMSGSDIRNSDFVRSRVGDEFWVCQQHQSSRTDQKPALIERLRVRIARLRESLAKMSIRLLLGKEKTLALEEGLFRNQGEIHRWMYDRYSLRQLCENVGFEDFKIQDAEQSDIDRFAEFELDAHAGQTRKPDSLFVECRKPLNVKAIKQKSAA